MSYCGYIVKIEKLRPHPNADKLQIATFFGNDTCVSLDCGLGDIGIYFPCDGQLSLEFCIANHLMRKLPDGTPDSGYMDPDKRNVKAIKLRGEKSDGIYLPISCLSYCFDAAMVDFKPGDTITVVNGHEICCKYIPRSNTPRGERSANRTRKKRVPIAPLFAEHADTEQLAYNLGVFKPGDEIEITLKMHGTSQRTGYLPVLKGYTGPGIALNILNRTGVFHFMKPTNKMISWAENKANPIYDWGYVSGTRRTVLENYDGGFYGSNEFREQHSKIFEGKLWKGESVYYEVVGFTDQGKPIMSEANNKKLNNPDFIKQYGVTTVFSYGCESNAKPAIVKAPEMIEVAPAIPQSDTYVYRMTMTNEDGNVVEYTPDFMRYRCEQMGVKTVPVMWKGTIPPQQMKVKINDTMELATDNAYETAGDYIKTIAEQYYDGPDPIGKTHIREGVVVRILNRPKFCAYKHKNFAFKVIEGIIKETAEAPDMEEADGLEDNNG